MGTSPRGHVRARKRQGEVQRTKQLEPLGDPSFASLSLLGHGSLTGSPPYIATGARLEWRYSVIGSAQPRTGSDVRRSEPRTGYLAEYVCEQSRAAQRRPYAQGAEAGANDVSPRGSNKVGTKSVLAKALELSQEKIELASKYVAEGKSVCLSWAAGVEGRDVMVVWICG